MNKSQNNLENLGEIWMHDSSAICEFEMYRSMSYTDRVRCAYDKYTRRTSMFGMPRWLSTVT